MIQRIQSIYLLIVSILAIVFCFYPIANINEQVLKFSKFIILDIISIIIATIAFVSIFLFKKRMLQIRINSFNIILMFFQLILSGIWVYLSAEGFNNIKTFSLNLSAILPIINIILSYLAIRAIGKDEAMVRAVDRIR